VIAPRRSSPIRRRARRDLVRPLVGLVLIAAFGIAAGRILVGPLGGVVARDLDTPVRSFVSARRDPAWVHRFSHVSWFGTAFVTGTSAVVVGAILALRRRRIAIFEQCVGAFVGAAALTVVVKFGVDRQPASGPIPTFAAGTFPSGHALFAFSVYGTFAMLVLRSGAPRVVRLTTAVLLAVLALAIAWSRVFLLDHYASDVIGSLVLGGAWAAVVAAHDRRDR
jgi:undecaprenyl-diphosphatase